MVLKLKDICLNFLAKSFSEIKNFNHALLTSAHKEIIIERLTNHNWLLLPTSTSQNVFNKSSECYQKRLIKSFFNGHLDSVMFNDSNQFDDDFISLIKELVEPNDLVIKSLVIDRCQKLTDRGISILLSNFCKNIQVISMTHLNIPLRATLCETLKSLNLCTVDLSFCISITDNDIWHLCKNNPFIKSLKLTNCIQLTNNGIRTSLHMLKKLENLDIEGIKDEGTSFFIDSRFSSINSGLNFKSIKKLSFCGSNELNGSISMKKILESCINLKELNIMYSSSSSESISNKNELFNNPLFSLSKSLISLSLYRPNIQNSNDLVESIAKLSNLEQLSLYGVGCLDDKSLIKILKSIGSQLTLLNLEGFMVFDKRLTDDSIKCISKYCKNLKSLSFNLFSTTANFDSLQTLFENTKTAFKFHELGFSACRNLSYDLLIQVGLNCINITKLDLSGLPQLVDDQLLISISNNATKLKCLDIKGCLRVTDESIINLAQKCPLEILILAGIGLLTDKSIFTIANHLQASLKEIYLSGCSKISTVSLNYLSDCCLKRLCCEHRVPNKDPNLLMAKNLDTGCFERVDLIEFHY